jgi:lysosomal Pro-X carboxypeptidase
MSPRRARAARAAPSILPRSPVSRPSGMPRSALAPLLAVVMGPLPPAVATPASASPPWGAGLAARCEWFAQRRSGGGAGVGGGCQHIPAAAAGAPPHPGVPNCTEHFFQQRVDHFGYGPAQQLPSNYSQRYFLNDQWWEPPVLDQTTGQYDGGGPIFFYTGNEANVELYVNATGLMWENCAQFRCLMVFAEHRYWGKSLLGPAGKQDLRFLTHEQALADYASLIYALKAQLHALDSAVIAFGGSYGGMLAYWFRQKYPGTVDGAIAASAPVLAFKGQTPAFDSETFWRVVTRDATPAAGAVAECAAGVRRAWSALSDAGQSAHGRSALQQQFGLCRPITDASDVAGLVDLLWFALDTMAMGDYPYPSNYLVRELCRLLPFMRHCGRQ